MCLKNNGIFTIAVFSLIVFIGIASYLWYLFFHEYENVLVKENSNMQFASGVELINTGNINYINATNTDSDSVIPVYYFSVKNKSNKDYNYIISLEDSEGNDGCSNATKLTRSELEYELKMDNKTIKTGGLETLSNNILDSNIVKSGTTNDYSIRIKIKADTTDYQDKHFHYVINMKEKE